MSDPVRRYLKHVRQPSNNGEKRRPAVEKRCVAKPQTAEAKPEPELGTILSTVKPQRVAWLWPGRIPLGKLTILDGDPGLGKSVLSLDLAARVSKGLSMPFEDREPGVDREPAGVVLLSAEDGLEDTVVPRLDAAGADRSRILALDTIPDGDGKRLPSLPGDAVYIRLAVQRMNALLVVVDPLTAYLGEFVNSHRDQDCRRALWPLAKVADETGAAVVVIRHLNKATGGNPLYRGGGSIGIIGAARSGLLVGKDPDNPDRRVLASTKSNLAKPAPSLAFDLGPGSDGALRIGWIGPCAHTAESLLAAPVDGEDRGAVQEAVEVLRTILAGSSLPAREVQNAAKRAGVSEPTLKRAKSILGVRSRLVGYGPKGEWQWSLSTTEEVETPREDQVP